LLNTKSGSVFYFYILKSYLFNRKPKTTEHMKSFAQFLILSLLCLYAAGVQAQEYYYLNSSGAFLNSEEKAQYRLSLEEENESTFSLYLTQKDGKKWSQRLFLQMARQLNDSVLMIADNKRMKDSYLRRIVGRDESGYIVKQYYESGKLNFIGQAITVFPLQLNGKTTVYDQEGMPMAEEVYIRGKKLGEQFLFNSMDSSKVITSNPEFPGGSKEFLKAIARSVTYPRSLLESGSGGKAYVKFRIDENGKMTEASAVGSQNNPEIVKELIHAILNMEIKWTPAKSNEEIIPVWHYATVKFNLPILLH